MSIKFDDYFYYDESSKSCLKWKVASRFKGNLTGKDVGGLDSKGYYVVKFMGRIYKVHRIVYCLHNSDFDYSNPLFIDHKNTERSDNKLTNLRVVTKIGNCRNVVTSKRNSSGITGVNLKVSKGDKSSYRTTWRDLKGKPQEKNFSINKYGEELAFFMACEYREQMISLLNLQGAGYSENHGKPKFITEIYE